MSSALLPLVAAALGGATACAPEPYHVRVEGGYQTQVGDDQPHQDYFIGSAGAGVQARNRRGRIAVTAEIASRPAANAALLSIEGNLLRLVARDVRYQNLGKGVTFDETSGLALVARVAAGPALGDHRHVAEAALGLGWFTDTVVEHSRVGMPPRSRYFVLAALEAVATRATADTHDDWMIGGRLSFTIPINIIDKGIDQRGLSVVRKGPWR